jgi:glycerol-3-phosphate dehydrogenase
MIPGFDGSARAAALAEMARSPVDVLIIGGGISGCGLARDAALRGLRVALIERDDFACGTSSRSTKIIHGGIRYLAYGDLRVVRESARERWMLRRIAPHLVHPIDFVYPLYADQWRLKYRLGFWLFDRLAAAPPGERHHMLTPAAVLERVPGLRPALTGGGVYPEFVTDDARLTLENAMSAAEHGALVANHAPVTAILSRDGRVRGATVRDAVTGDDLTVMARVVVNATGVWAERTLGLGARAPAHHLLPSKGIHLLFHADRLPLAGATHVRASDGREGIAVRRWDYVYVGTTDIEYHGPLEHPTADADAIADVLRMTRDCFRGLDLTADDVLGTWAGVRPLVAEPGKSTRETSRRDEIWEGSDGLISLVGGKLTTYRAMAQRAMQRILPRLGRGADPSADRTQELVLPGARTDNGDLAGELSRIDARLAARAVDAATRRRVLWLYGARTRQLLEYGDEDEGWLRPLAPKAPVLRGEARLAVEHEMALTLEDFLDRRTSLLLFSDDQGRACVDAGAAVLGQCLGWDDARRDTERERYLSLARGLRPRFEG